MSRVLILGIGSDHGDDSLGWEALRRLRKKIGNGQEIEFVECDASILNCNEKISQSAKLVLIDAIANNGEAGEIYRFDLHSELSAHTRIKGSMSSHGLNVLDSVRVLIVLGLLPKESTLWGIEPGPMEPNTEISSRVLKSVERLVQTIFDELVVNPVNS
ncbi:MAG: hydrogenase maturation protease [Gammaproteobacteria bacterium]|nr:hydrogenase maturation protease [Gammaproteobacteria bacterium]